MVITDIKNTKIRVENEEHSEDIQNLAGKFGYKWRGEDFFKVSCVSARHLYFSKNCHEISFGDGVNNFEEKEHKEIFFYNGEFHDKPQDEIDGWDGDLPNIGVDCVFTPDNTMWGFNYVEDFRGQVLHYSGERFVFMLHDEKERLEDESIIVSRIDKGVFKPYVSKEEIEKQERLEAVELMMQIGSTGGIFDSNELKWACEKLYNAGYRKGDL